MNKKAVETDFFIYLAVAIIVLFFLLMVLWLSKGKLSSLLDTIFEKMRFG